MEDEKSYRTMFITLHFWLSKAMNQMSLNVFTVLQFVPVSTKEKLVEQICNIIGKISSLNGFTYWQFQTIGFIYTLYNCTSWKFPTVQIVNIANIKIHILESMERGKNHTQRKPNVNELVVMKSFLLLKINTL